MKLKDNSNNIIRYNNRNKRIYFLTNNINHRRNNLNKINLNKKIEFILDTMKREDNKQLRFSNVIKNLDLNTNIFLSTQENPKEDEKEIQNQKNIISAKDGYNQDKKP